MNYKELTQRLLDGISQGIKGVSIKADMSNGIGYGSATGSVWNP